LRASQEQIDKINDLVYDFKVNGNMESAEKLLMEFDSYLKKQTHKLFSYYQGVYPWDHAFHEAQLIFYQLLTEYTIGGDAYFTVYIQRKLPLRLRYFFAKEIKRRTRNLSHSDEQFIKKRLIKDTEDVIQKIEDDIVNSEKLQEILDVINDGKTLTDRERDMLLSSIVNQESHQSISERYGISRSRVSRIIKASIEKIQSEVKYRE